VRASDAKPWSALIFLLRKAKCTSVFRREKRQPGCTAQANQGATDG
jgi:hypothetical protein